MRWSQSFVRRQVGDLSSSWGRQQRLPLSLFVVLPCLACLVAFLVAFLAFLGEGTCLVAFLAFLGEGTCRVGLDIAQACLVVEYRKGKECHKGYHMVTVCRTGLVDTRPACLVAFLAVDTCRVGLDIAQACLVAFLVAFLGEGTCQVDLHMD